MHGLVVEAFRDYIESRHGRSAWDEVVASGDVVISEGLPNLDRIYPDHVLAAAVTNASAVTGIPMPTMLDEFGAFLAPILLRLYKDQVKDSWRTLDIIENTEARIHTVVRRRDPDAAPPAIIAKRVSESEVSIEYTSTRRLCYVAEGIARGLADHFNEIAEVRQTECMHRGDGRCLISVTVLGNAQRT